MKKILIIGSGELLNRLPESLANPQIVIDVFDRKGSVLSKSEFVQNFIELDVLANEPFHKAVFKKRKFLAELAYDYYLFADDLIGLEFARKSKDTDLQLKLLPVKAEAGIELVGSKVGFVKLANLANIKFPKSLVAQNATDLVSLSKQFESQFLVKADVGGGGSTVKRFNQSISKQEAQKLKSWFPAVIQEEITGTLISVEGMFDSGKLLGWTYSKFDVESWEFGPSTRRTFLEPPSFDFEETLTKFGQVSGFHGFINATFIWNPEEEFHYLFEADNRANGWHQFAHRFGINWGHLYANSDQVIKPVRPSLSKSKVTFSLFPREPVYAINTGKWKPVFFWLLNSPGTWESRNNKDKAINAAEWLELKNAIKNRFLLKAGKPFRFIVGLPRKLHLAIAKLFVWGWQSIPSNQRDKLDRIGVKKLIVFLFRV